MKYLILLALLAVAVHSAHSLATPTDKVDCSKIWEVLDDVGGAQGFTTLNDKYKLATTPEEFTKRCQEMADAIKTLRKYNKECSSSLTQQVFSAMIRTRSQMNEEYCKPDTPAAKDALEATKCIQTKALDSVKEAEKKIILTSQLINDANIPDDKLRLRRACCGVIASKGIFLDATKAACKEHEKVYSDYVDSYTSEAMGLICPEKDKLECDKLEALKIDGVEPKTKFFLSPMLKVVKSLDH